MPKTYDFGGWATRNNTRCSDGRVIRRGAFKDNNGTKVPLVWNHQHNSPDNILGHALLEDREEGVYAYCKFNDSEAGLNAKTLVEHGDIESLSIYANQLKQKGSDVLHGAIKEVSLVLAGANPGAFIDTISFAHGNESEDEGYIYTGKEIDYFMHGDYDDDEYDYDDEDDDEYDYDDEDDDEYDYDDEDDDEDLEHADEIDADDFSEILGTLNDEQMDAVKTIIGLSVMDAIENPEKYEGEIEMKHNVFDTEDRMDESTFLSHSDMEMIFSDAKRCGSLREAVETNIDDGILMHATTIPTTGMEVATGNQKYGLNDPNMLFPEYRSFQTTPEWISRDMAWVAKVMGAVHHSPFSRIKSVYANITEDEARAKGYMKGKLKKEEVFSLLKRKTDPQTIYKKQKMDRDDIIDITDFDVVAWIKAEMRVMLNEEIARAILVGDGRLVTDDDHISEEHVRPIWKESDLFAVKVRTQIKNNATDNERAKAIVRSIIKARKDYKGSGEPTLFTTEDMLTDMLLIEDGVGRLLYPTVQQLATTLRVKEIVTVEAMEGLKRTEENKTYNLMGIIVNLRDYNVGADKGGAINMFEDFDIDYNQEKYLIETRISGALVKPYSALVLESETVAAP